MITEQRRLAGMVGPKCPECRRPTGRRCHRTGAIELLLSVAHIYPFRCSVCQRRFRVLRWGKRYWRLPRDRRKYERLHASAPAVLHVDGDRIAGTAISLSRSGCAITTRASLRIGALVKVELAIAGATLVVIDGATVRSVRPGILGLAFPEMRPDQTRRLRQVLENAVPLEYRPRRVRKVRVRVRTIVQWVATVALTALAAMAFAR